MTIQFMNSCWKRLPTRDEVLDRAYFFLQALANKDPEKASEYIVTTSLTDLREEMNKSLQQFVLLNFEDEDMPSPDADLSLEITDPFDVEEELLFPEFTGNSFEVQLGEVLSLRLCLHGISTEVRIHFVLAESDRLYMLKVQSVSTS
ncbi:MAG: hypothetical protein WD077_08940 [Bacteroidia bacterium]